MKICGIITEYNPFHNGHLYNINKAKEVTGADKAVIVMSGYFTERGEPALIDKYERTKQALLSGGDIVFELPAAFAVSSAETFALGAVSLLDSLNSVDYLCFGLEDNDPEALDKIALILSEEPEIFKEALKKSLKNGASFPLAREEALKKCPGAPENVGEILKKPNNILGIEYLKVLHKLNSKIEPAGIKRLEAGYNSLVPGKNIASALYIRSFFENENTVSENELSGIKNFVPEYVSDYLLANFNKSFPVTENDFSVLLQYLLEEHKEELTDYRDFSYEIACKVKKKLPGTLTFTEWAETLKSKDITLSRVRRALFSLVLDIKAKDFEEYKKAGGSLYLRLLGFRKESEDLLKIIKENSRLPLIGKMADTKKTLSGLPLKLLETDIKAANLYRSAVYSKYNYVLKDEYRAEIVKI